MFCPKIYGPRKMPLALNFLHFCSGKQKVFTLQDPDIASAKSLLLKARCAWDLDTENAQERCRTGGSEMRIWQGCRWRKGKAGSSGREAGFDPTGKMMKGEMQKRHSVITSMWIRVLSWRAGSQSGQKVSHHEGMRQYDKGWEGGRVKGQPGRR